MNYVDFFLLAENNVGLLILLTLGAVFIYLIIYRKYILSVFDPMFFAIVASGLANSIVFYLYFLDQIRYYYFQSFLITEVCFILGFFIFKPIKSVSFYLSNKCVSKKKSSYDKNFITIMFYWASVIHVISQITTYAVVGLPILMESRLTAYSGGSGFGLVGRFVDVSSGIGIFLLFYRMFYCRPTSLNKIYNYLYLFFVIISFILSGNKTNLLFLIYYLFILNMFMLKIDGAAIEQKIKKTLRLQRLFLFISIPLVFAIQLITSTGEVNFNDSMLVLMKRIVSFGDIYYLTLPNDVISQLAIGQSSLLQLFKDPLGVLRIVPWSELPIDSGFAVTDYHFGIQTAGPNPRYNYFAMLYYDILGQGIYCFLVGVVISFIRNKLFYLMPKNIFFGCIYASVSINIIYAFQDMPTLVLHLFSIVLVLPVILFLTLITLRVTHGR